MNSQPLDIFPLWVLFPASAVLLWLALEGGYRLGMWREARAPGEQEQSVGAMVASILGLLALVLGFTFSLAASRFDARRQAVLEEANAIGTTYLRTRLLPEPERSEIAELLREYVDLRVEAVKTEPIEKVVARSEALHEKIWSRAVAASEKSPGSISTGLFVQSLNEMIDLHAKRVMVGMRSRIPVVVWFCVFGLSLIGMAAVGYQGGLAKTRRSLVMYALVICFATVLYLIADLDRGHAGLLRVGQQALVDLQKSMAVPTP